MPQVWGVVEAIKGFFGPYRFLSNFYIEPDGSFVEYEFQRAKCATWAGRGIFDKLYSTGKLTPKQAKAIGRKVEMREDWEAVKVNIMLFYIKKKFTNSDLMWQLQQTSPAYLEETNMWGDTFWGVCRGVGQNMLGAILMQVRDEQ